MIRLGDGQVLRIADLGKGVPYKDAMAHMVSAVAEVDAGGPVLFLLEHSPVITTTRQGGDRWLTSTREEIEAAGIALLETDRGGDVTFHGPGQLVGYPVIRLPPSELLDGKVDLLGYLRALEDGLVNACVRLGVQGAHKKSKMTGVWVASDVKSPADRWPDDDDAMKLVAIGVGVNKGVTRHGFALNMSTELERYTSHIVPCGLEGRGVTSLEKVLDALPPPETVKAIVVREVTDALRAFLVGEHSDTSLPVIAAQTRGELETGDEGDIPELDPDANAPDPDDPFALG